MLVMLLEKLRISMVSLLRRLSRFLFFGYEKEDN